MAANLYGSIYAKMANKEIDLDTDTVKVALVTSAYTFDQDAHDYFNDITNEVTGSGYTAGGATLASKTVGYTAGTNTFKFDAADVTWANSTITARGAVVYVSTGVASTSPLLAYFNFGSDKISSGGDFDLVWDAAGIFTLTVS